jgi:hypothetical protein
MRRLTQPTKRLYLAFSVILIAVSVLAKEPRYPVKVSQNGRYFVDQQGKPVFWLGTTQWQLFRDYDLDEAKLMFQRSKAHGFTFMQVMLVGVGDGNKANVYGQKPWLNENPVTPNERYFTNVDAVFQVARDNNIIICLTIYHQTNRKYITTANAHAWAKWVASRYKDVPNIIWCLVPEAKPEFIPILRYLAAGLHDGDASRHLITVEPDPAPYSSSFLHDEKWLNFDCIQTWKSVELIYPMVTKDYNLKPVKPVLMAEGAYESGSEYGFNVTPLWVRRQAYYSYLCGGPHTYGHNDSWRVLPSWKEALDAPGAVQMGILKKIFLARKEWCNLVPDQSIFTSGGNTNGQILNLAARHNDGQWIMAYLGSKASFTIDMTKVKTSGNRKVFWIDPRTGDTRSMGSFPNRRGESFSTPGEWEDALLIVEPDA